jgi:hypothetical protein
VYAEVRAPLLHLPNYAVTAFGERLDRHGTEPGFTAVIPTRTSTRSATPTATPSSTATATGSAPALRPRRSTPSVLPWP